MKIIDNSSERGIEFGGLSIGSCFLYAEKTYMKCIEALGNTSHEYNAVDLETGELTTFGCKVVIKPINATVTIN